MNGQSTVNHPTNNNEQLIGKFHVVNVDKLPINPISSHDETTTTTASTAVGQQQPMATTAAPPAAAAALSTTDEPGCASRFQMIRVDRNFGRGRWKVNDYEPPENISTSTNQPVNTIENEPVNISNSSTLSTAPTTSITTLPNNIPSGLQSDSNATSSATLAATAASAAAAAATAFQQQQQQQRMAMNNPAAIPLPANVPPPTNLLHSYPQAQLPNLGAPNQSYMLPNHPQFSYYPFFPSPYSPYAAQWAAMAAANHFLPPPPIPTHQQQTSQLSTGNLGDGIRYTDTVPDVLNENPVISSNLFSNLATDHLQNSQMANAPFLYTTHHAHSPYVSQPPPNTVSPYATIASYHPVPPPPTIIPPPAQPLSLAQIIQNTTTDIQQQPQSHPMSSSQQQQQQQAPILTSPKQDASSTKTSVQQSTIPKTTTAATVTIPTNLPKPLTATANGPNNDTLRTTSANPTHITDLLSSSPSIPNSQPPPSLLSPITVQTNNPNKTATTSLTDMWPYAGTGSPLNLSQAAAQTAAVTAVAAMGLLTNESGKNTEMANEILKELTTPTKQNNTTDIDNKISAAMDLVKMHLLSAVREEVTELRQQIRTLNEKLTSVEHENAFLRQHVPSEIYAQYTPLFVGLSTANDSSNSTTTTTTAATTASSVPLLSSQPLPPTSLPSLPLSVVQQQQQSLSTTSQPPPPPPSSSSINLPPT